MGEFDGGFVMGGLTAFFLFWISLALAIVWFRERKNHDRLNQLYRRIDGLIPVRTSSTSGAPTPKKGVKLSGSQVARPGISAPPPKPDLRPTTMTPNLSDVASRKPPPSKPPRPLAVVQPKHLKDESRKSLAIQVDWERWLGIRGAALLGGIVLALAGLLFLRYSIEHGLIPPETRVMLGLLVGVVSILGSEMLRNQNYRATANSLAGTGVVLLYGSVWAAHSLYELIPYVLAFPSMALATLICGLLAWRHRSQVTALIGLAGGFATPLLLASIRDNPIGFFGYILLLDCGLLVLAHRCRWPAFPLLALGGTVFHQAFWIASRMGPDQAGLGLLVLGIFTLFFALTTSLDPGGESGKDASLRFSTRLSGVFIPFAFAVYFAANAELAHHLLPVSALLLTVSVAALWLDRSSEDSRLAPGASAGCLGVVLVWSWRSSFDAALAWELVGICVALSLVFHLFVEIEGRSSDGRRSQPGEGLLAPAPGFLALLIILSVKTSVSPWPWLAGWVVLAALLVRQSLLSRSGSIWLVAAVGPAVGFVLYFWAHGDQPIFPRPTIFFGLALAVAVVFQLLAVRFRENAATQRASEVGAALAPLVLLVGMSTHLNWLSSPSLFLPATLVFALLPILSASRIASGAWYFTAMTVTAFSHCSWWLWDSNFRPSSDGSGLALVCMTAALLLFTAWPFLSGARLLADRWGLYASALAGPFWFLALRDLFEERFGGAAIGIVPLALAVLSLGAVLRVRNLWRQEDPRRKRSLVWFAGVGLSFVAISVPVQLEREWITVGWSLVGLAAIVLWKRLDHVGLQYYGLLLLALASIRLLANPAVLGYYPASDWPVFNWLMYTYLVPAGALLGSARVLHEVECARKSAIAEHLKGCPTSALACVGSAILVVFVWINLAVLDYYSGGTSIVFSLERLPARDLTLSLAWTLYALILLSVGMLLKSVQLRWVSLCFLVLVMAKVFLYDLGELEDLYRVASLVGLAVSLIMVSLGYQRFVFRRVVEDG